MKIYVLSPLAREDLNEIWRYSVDRWDSDQAESYLRLLQNAIATLARHPFRAPACDDIRPGYRKFNAGSHVIFFRISDGEVEVIRILHQSMDPALHL